MQETIDGLLEEKKATGGWVNASSEDRNSWGYKGAAQERLKLGNIAQMIISPFNTSLIIISGPESFDD